MNIRIEHEPGALLAGLNAEWKDEETGLPNRIIFTCDPAHTQINYRYAAHQETHNFLIRVWSGFLNSTIYITAETLGERDALFDADVVPDEINKPFGTIRLLFIKRLHESVPSPTSSSSSGG